MILIADIEFPDPDDTGDYCEIAEDGSVGPTLEGHCWRRANNEGQARIIPKAGSWVVVEHGCLVASGATLHAVDAKRILGWLETGDWTLLVGAP